MLSTKSWAWYSESRPSRMECEAIACVAKARYSVFLGLAGGFNGNDAGQATAGSLSMATELNEG